jgi:DNA replication licensing factor MCM5
MSPAGAGSANPFGAQFTPQQEEEFGEMAGSDGFYEHFAKSVATSIFGSLGMSSTPLQQS